METKCPDCGLLNPPNAQRCDCGHEFAAQIGRQTDGSRIVEPRPQNDDADCPWSGMKVSASKKLRDQRWRARYFWLSLFGGIIGGIFGVEYGCALLGVPFGTPSLIKILFASFCGTIGSLLLPMLSGVRPPFALGSPRARS
jgi:hypothetical protein